MATTLRIILFPGLAAWNVWIGQSQGFYEREDLVVVTTPTPGSVYQFERLHAGEFDLAFTAFDNLVAYNEGQGEVALPGTPDFVCVLGGDNGFLGLNVRPEIHSYEDLRGKQLVVDAVNTGFSFVLRKMLAVQGLRNDEYTLVPVGNTQARMEKMLSGPEFVAGLLTPPLDVVAQSRGLKLLSNATDVLGSYQANCVIASKAWLGKNSEALVRFLRGHVRAIEWLGMPANENAAKQLLVEKAKMTPATADGAYAKVVNGTGTSPKGAIDVAGIQTVLDLRAEFGIPKKPLGDPAKYYDTRYYREAVG